jgi:hypothetical protein
MNRINKKDLLATASRWSLTSSAKAAEVIFESEKFLRQTIPSRFLFRVRCFRGGILYIQTENPALSQKIYASSEHLLEYLRERFPHYDFRSVRTEVSSR